MTVFRIWMTLFLKFDQIWTLHVTQILLTNRQVMHALIFYRRCNSRVMFCLTRKLYNGYYLATQLLWRNVNLQVTMKVLVVLPEQRSYSHWFQSFSTKSTAPRTFEFWSTPRTVVSTPVLLFSPVKLSVVRYEHGSCKITQFLLVYRSFDLKVYPPPAENGACDVTSTTEIFPDNETCYMNIENWDGITCGVEVPNTIRSSGNK